MHPQVTGVYKSFFLCVPRFGRPIISLSKLQISFVSARNGGLSVGM